MLQPTGWGMTVVVGVLLIAACTSSETTTRAVPTSAGVPSTSAPGLAASIATPASTASPAASTSVAVEPPTTTAEGLASRLATTATDLAAQLVAVERTVREPDASPEAVRLAGENQQLIYRRLGRDAVEWQAVAAALAPDVLAPATRNVEAAAAFAAKAAASTAPPSETLPAWTIAEPLPADTLIAWYREAEALTRVPWSLLAAINLVETRMGRIVGVSSAGAVGPMQFLPSTWEGCCVGDPTDPHDAIIGAATYLASNGAPGDLTRAVRRYNPNDAYITAVLAYATNIADDERAYSGYHAWQVFVGSAVGSLRLPVGYAAGEPVDAATYLADHPEDRA
jgi:hypothetical protein